MDRSVIGDGAAGNRGAAIQRERHGGIDRQGIVVRHRDVIERGAACLDLDRPLDAACWDVNQQLAASHNRPAIEY